MSSIDVIITADGHITSVEVGAIVMTNNELKFKYLPNENVSNLWPSKSLSYSQITTSI